MRPTTNSLRILVSDAGEETWVARHDLWVVGLERQLESGFLGVLHAEENQHRLSLRVGLGEYSDAGLL